LRTDRADIGFLARPDRPDRDDLRGDAAFFRFSDFDADDGVTLRWSASIFSSAR
jgi:hypothetical protein